ncbi:MULTISPECIES: NAD-dependent epimerase/dehydratase family protein [unclassified Cyanobium]|uniref:NAD-dependent epimerase/dehydratase family protein n=1 Tax=unclassified Cyanobium TaxID=2627006 RepID=UPI0020CBF690|nr:MULTISPECIES: NAD-dependent epimerase/dehydratase family protein [unclassified Cyanobium]MCP9834426.1 NAD-dependent epimerase/dehydratase family protein [Cyanobium sp. La Preciosa 7G6]MCP9937202.1 NAD-dependent epimerase/dehydratase family protein [Cyanobium sp. Aljojuca 7A6]
MKTIVIGGAGFIGSLVSQALIASGREVTVVGRRPPGAHTSSLPCAYRCADLGNRAQMREILETGCEVIDLAYATVPKTSYGDPVFDLLANLPGSVGLLEEAMAVGVRRLLLVSSGGTVYGPPCALPIAESHPTAPISPYGITKLTIDHYALMFHHTRDLPVVVVRPANAYGIQQRSRTGQGFLAAAIDAILSRREIEIYGDVGTIRDYIHVTDVASGILAALDFGGDGEIYNLGTGIGASNLDVITLLRPLVEAAGHTLEVNHLPARRFDVDANVLDAQKLFSVSGWRAQVSLQNGLAQMWDHALKASSL